MPIRILPSELVNQIAAGEVVERPASVVKELVENAIDAGASTIDVILENGGKKLIEVRDDGTGMSSSDALLALGRHATSKIAVFDDLLSVSTLGFRGEALPSIASVSRFSLVTWNGVEEHATEVAVGPGGEIEARPAARDRGTTVAVRELFENVPARRKFLKSTDAEFRSIVSVVSSYALPEPRRAFRLEHNGRIALDLPPAADRRARAVQILGRDAAEQLCEASSVIGSCRASGFVTRGLRFGSRRNQYFFVNGRLVKDRVLAHAASRAADAFDFEGHPAIILFLEIPCAEVDVNVHPAKTEVRFRDSGQVHVAVEEAVRKALGGAAEGAGLLSADETPAPAFGLAEVRNGADAAPPPAGLFPRPLAPVVPPAEPRYDFSPLFRESAVVQPPRVPAEEAEPAAPQLGALRGRVIGQYRMSYILVDTPVGLRLIDQHAAHERILYERLDARRGTGGRSQQLLTPVILTLGAAESALLESHLSELVASGFEIARFSGQSFAVSAVPPELSGADIEAFVRKLLDASSDEKRPHLEVVRHRVIASIACQAAIKVHRPLSGEEMARLTADLLEAGNPWACPHGRPTIIDIRQADIEKSFHRR